MNKLNSLVWPGIAAEVSAMIKQSDSKVIVMEAAVLLVAHWEKYCHEVFRFNCIRVDLLFYFILFFEGVDYDYTTRRSYQAINSEE